MRFVHLILREVHFRKGNTLLIILSVAAAVSSVLAPIILLNAFDRGTERFIARKEAALQTQMASMEDEYRKLTKRMGFNVMILPKDQDLSDFYAENYARAFMPETYADRLARSRDIITVRHLLPLLQQKLEWPEQKRKVLLIGVRGQTAAAHQTGSDPLIKPVPPGAIAIGHELHNSLGLKPDDTVSFMGRQFRVAALHPPRGTIDDITLWMDLAEAQELVGRQGWINAIVALECECAFANLPKIRSEIQRVLPDTQVIELAGKALARAEARQEAERNAKALIEQERTARQQLRERRAELVSVLVPMAVVVCAVWVGLLTWLNARERRAEIGVLRAIGFPTWKVLAIFIGKAALLGATGATAGVGACLAAAPRLAAFMGDPGGAPILPAAALVLTLILAPLSTIAASWLPALHASMEDPADALRAE